LKTIQKALKYNEKWGNVICILRKAHVHFRNDISTGPGGSQILLDDPSGNPIELFQPAAVTSDQGRLSTS